MNADRANAVGVAASGRRDSRGLRTIELLVIDNGNVESCGGIPGENGDSRRYSRLGRVGGGQVHRQVRRQDKGNGDAARGRQYTVALGRLRRDVDSQSRQNAHFKNEVPGVCLSR